MGPKALGLCAAIGAATLGACASPHAQSSRHAFHPPLFTKPPEADAFAAVLIARYATLTNDPAEAVDQYASVLDQLPDGDPIAARGVFAALMSGDFEQAVAFADKAMAGERGGSSLCDLTLAVNDLARHDTRAAGKRLSLDRYGPFNRAMAINVQAWMALETDGLAAAEAVLQQAETDGFAVHSVTLAMAGLLQLAAGEDATALATFERLDHLGPRLAIATAAQARLLASMGQPSEALAKLERFRAEVGIHPELTALDRQIHAGLPVQPPRLDLAEGAALGIYAPAAALAARSDSDLPGVYFALALQLDPTLDIARTLWAESLDRGNRRAEAIAILEAVDPASPFYATARGQLAWARLREGDGAEALAVARAALADTGDRDLKVQYGDLLVATADDLGAETVFTDLISHDAANGREDWRLYFARGAVRERLGHWSDAEADLTHALALAPDNPDVMTHLGLAWAERQRNLDTAVPMLERAARLKPEASPIIGSLGWAYFQVGRYDDAIRQLERAVELDPTNAVSNDHLGDAYWRSGRTLEASYQWERALGLDPAQARAERLRRKLVAGLPPQASDLVDASLAAPDGPAVQP